MDTRKVPSVLVLWEKVMEKLLVRTASFPKIMRMTVTNRIETIMLDVYDKLIEAQYTRRPIEILQRINLDLERLRLLLRLSYRRKFLSEGGLRLMIEQIDETGRMVGGWRRSEERKS